MTWGHCHFVLNKSPGGKLTFERDQKASSCDAKAPSPVSLGSGSMWMAQTWAHVATLMHSLPASMPKACAKTHGISQHLLFSLSALPRSPSNSGLKYQSRWRDNQRSFTVTAWDKFISLPVNSNELSNSFFNQEFPCKPFFAIHSPNRYLVFLERFQGDDIITSQGSPFQRLTTLSVKKLNCLGLKAEKTCPPNT